MCRHYLFEPYFCNRASGWEKGIVEKNMQDRRRQIWNAAIDLRWATLADLNTWLAQRCEAAWESMARPEWPAVTVAEVLQDERMQLIPMPKPFDSYVEQPVRVSATSLIYRTGSRTFPALLKPGTTPGASVTVIRTEKSTTRKSTREGETAPQNEDLSTQSQ